MLQGQLANDVQGKQCAQGLSVTVNVRISTTDTPAPQVLARQASQLVQKMGLGVNNVGDVRVVIEAIVVAPDRVEGTLDPLDPPPHVHRVRQDDPVEKAYDLAPLKFQQLGLFTLTTRGACIVGGKMNLQTISETEPNG